MNRYGTTLLVCVNKIVVVDKVDVIFSMVVLIVLIGAIEPIVNTGTVGEGASVKTGSLNWERLVPKNDRKDNKRNIVIIINKII